MPLKADNTINRDECTRLVAVLLSAGELKEIEGEFTREASTASTTDGLSVLAKVRDAAGRFR